MCERKKIMSSVNAINSNVSFGRAKAASKKAERADVQQPKPKFSELGNRTMSEKYGDVNINTNTAGIVLGDYILDHAIEFASTALLFLGALSTGKALTNKTSGQFVDAFKNATGTKVLEVGKKYIGQIAGNVNEMKLSNPLKVGKAVDALKDVGRTVAGKAEPVEIMEGSVIDKLANKLGNLNADRVLGKNEKAAEKTGNAVDYQVLEENAAKIGQETTEAVKTFFAKRGIERGADLVDGGIALTGAGVAAGVGNGFVDKLTDLNDANVAQKAENAEQQHRAEQIRELVKFAYDAI